MYSTRCFAIFALIAAASALPASDKPVPKPVTTIDNDDFLPVMPAPWFSVPYFGDITKIFAPLWKLFPSFEDLGPRILSDDDKLQVIVQVKDYTKEDLKVKVKGDYIFVQGTHEAKGVDKDLFASQFFHTYTLPSNSSGADVTAELTNDGYLIVNAPITDKANGAKEADRVVEIVETGAPLNAAVPDANRNPQLEDPEIQPEVPSTTGVAETEIVSEEDRREPTTARTDREEITENTNVIPHGNNELNEVTP